MTSTDLIALGQAWGGPLTALITGGWGFALACLRYRKWSRQNRGMKGPKSNPSMILPLVLIMSGGLAGAAQLTETRNAIAKAGPAKKDTACNSSNCPAPACKCVSNDCRCAGQQRKIDPPPPVSPKPASSLAKLQPQAGELDGLWFVGDAPGATFAN